MKILHHLFLGGLLCAGGGNGFVPSASLTSMSNGVSKIAQPLTQTVHHDDISRCRTSFQSTKLLVAPGTSSPKEGRGLDGDAVVKYGVALGVQIVLFYGFFTLLDNLVSGSSLDVPFWANCVLFYAMSLRSRVFNPLSNKRPDPTSLETEGQENKRNLPSWTPPGVVFPIMWLLIIGPIRAVTTAMVYAVTHSYAAPAIMAYAIHLSIGDVWNTINNVEQRFGTAVTGVACVWLSKANTAYQYAAVSPLAGQIMTIPLLWLTIASALVTRTWQLNPDESGDIEPLYPVKGKATTEFAWFQ